jgi:hypothetical protein
MICCKSDQLLEKSAFDDSEQQNLYVTMMKEEDKHPDPKSDAHWSDHVKIRVLYESKERGDSAEFCLMFYSFWPYRKESFL